MLMHYVFVILKLIDFIPVVMTPSFLIDISINVFGKKPV